MSKAILISIKPKYIVDILNGRKTIEIRKTMPKCDLPIDVYIYCTKDSKQLVHYQDVPNEDFSKRESFFETKQLKTKSMFNGKIVAKFTLNKIQDVEFTETKWGGAWANALDYSCLTHRELTNYLNGKGYAWHISNLVIFDKPKELSEFKNYKKFVSYDYTYTKKYVDWELRPLTKAPQSWCYVESED